MTEILPATEKDIAFCTRLEKECFSEPWSETAFTQAMFDMDTYFYIAFENGVPVGYFVAGNICDEVSLYTIAVSHKARGKGIGDALISSLISLSRNERASFIGLEVRCSNTSAIRLYEKHGFVLSGQRPSFYRKPTEDALLYNLYLNEEIL